MAEKIIHNNRAKMKRKPNRARLLSMDECQHRPCEVDGHPALFHRWIEEDRALLQVECFVDEHQLDMIVRRFHEVGLALPGYHYEVIRETFALVEYQDGTIATVKPELIRFTDRLTKP